MLRGGTGQTLMSDCVALDMSATPRLAGTCTGINYHIANARLQYMVTRPCCCGKTQLMPHSLLSLAEHSLPAPSGDLTAVQVSRLACTAGEGGMMI